MQEHIQHYELIVTLEKTEFIWNRLRTLQNMVYEKIIAVTKLNVLAMSSIDGALNISYIIILVWGIYGIQQGTFTYMMQGADRGIIVSKSPSSYYYSGESTETNYFIFQGNVMYIYDDGYNDDLEFVLTRVQ